MNDWGGASILDAAGHERDLVVDLVAAQAPALELVAAERVPTYELPRLASGIDQGALDELAQLLRHQGMA